MTPWLRDDRASALLATAALLALACGPPADEEVETVEVDEVMEMPAPEPESVPFESARDLGLPQDFPDDIKLRSGTDLLDVTEKEGGVTYVQTTAEGDFDEVMEFYEKSLQDDGWTTTRKMDPGGAEVGGVIIADKPGRRTAVIITNTDGDPLVDLLILPPEGS